MRAASIMRLPAAAWLLIVCAPAQAPPSAQLLLHQTVEREIAPGHTEAFTVDAAAGQFLHVVLYKEGADAVVVLADPEGKPLVTANSPNRAYSAEPASLIAERAGAYQVRVATADGSSLKGRYRIELTDLRVPTAQDRTRVQAETEFYAAAAGGGGEQAIAGFQRAAALFHTLHDPFQEALCLHRTGATYLGLGERQKALDAYNQALALRRAVKDRAGEAATLNNIGQVYRDLQDRHKALDYYLKALPLERTIGDRGLQGMTLNSIGQTYYQLGDKQKSQEFYTQALAASRDAGDRDQEAGTLTNLGLVYKELGENRKALENYQQALPLLRAAGDQALEATALNNMGNVYLDLGEKQKALDYYNQALPLFHAAGDQAGEAMALTNIGIYYTYLGEKQKALDNYGHALPLFRAAGDRAREAETLSAIGDMYADRGEKRKALDYYNQALPLERAVGARAAEAETLNSIGKAYADLGEKPRALKNYTQALRLARAVSDTTRQGLVLSNLVSYWQAQSNPRLAIFFGKQAVNLYQDIRRGLQGLEPQLQRTYLATVTDDYRRLADLLIAQGRLAEAEQVLGLLKEEEFFDYVRREATEASVNARTGLTPEEADSDKRYREISVKLTAIGVEREDLLAKQDRTPDETRHLDELERDIAAGNAAFEKFLDSLPERFSAKPVALQDVRETEGIMADLRELPPGTVALYTLVGEDKLRTILRTPDVQKAYEYPIAAAELNRKVLEFRKVVKNPRVDPRALGEEVFQIVVGPLAQDLQQAKARTLMWSLDGVLRYLPLAALYDGKQYLIEQYALSVMTLASNTRLLGRPDPVWKAAGFGVTRAFDGAPALPSVSSELADIIASKPGDAGIMTGEIKLDGEFTDRSLREELRKRYPVVHIASHFRFQPGDETQSFLLLGDGSHLSMSELKTSANMFAGVQLLTLSACNTGVGDGTEVEGFGTLAQRQGAKAVIASLWPVADASTSLLMSKFYRIRESSPGKPKLEAMREAQLELLRGVQTPAEDAPQRMLVYQEEPESTAATPFKFDRKAPYAHPYFWAPFFLMGNWL